MIAAYFEDKGLVRQQLSSFDDFINDSLDQIVEQSPAINIKPERQYVGQDDAITDEVREHRLDSQSLTIFYLCSPQWMSEQKEFRIGFGKLSLCKPKVTDSDGTFTNIYPNEARLCDAT